MKRKSIYFVLMIGIICNITNIYAYENNTDDIIGQAKYVDKDGSINEIDVYDGTTNEEYNPYVKTVSTANMVNFNCSKAGITTTYTDYYTGQDGYLSKASAADGAFLGYENGKVKFMISGVTGLVDEKYVEILSQGTYYASNYEVNSNGDLYHYISNNVNASGNQGNKNYIGEGPSYLTKNKEYYSYDGHYFYSNYNMMINDYKSNTRKNSVNPNNPYYNYFQYLPMRSQTNYTGSQISNYLNTKAGSASKLYNTGDIFIKYQNEYGVNALMAASLAALESNWGKSNIALNKNNLFGLNATDNNPGGNADTFNSVDDCIMNFTSSWMSKRYLNPTYSSLFRGGYFGDKSSGIFVKYSSDPYEGEKCASIARAMDTSSKDKDYYTLGIKDIDLTTHTALNVRSNSSTSSTILYTTIRNPSYSFIVKDTSSVNGFYKIQNESANANGTFNFNNIGYVSNQYITLLGKTTYKEGWQEIDHQWYYIYSNGTKATGLQTIGNDLFYFNNSGMMQTGWQQVNGKWYYFNVSGYGQKGWQLIGNNWFYFNDSYQMLTGWQKINGKWYYLSIGIKEIYGKTYYEGYMITGWLPLNNEWYYLDKDGMMVTGLQTIGNNLCYFNDSGKMQTNWQQVNGKWYYFNVSGYGQKGWQLIGNNWFYFNDSYQMLTGWQKINGKWYYLSTGVMNIYGKTYYEGYMITGWLPLNNEWYYLRSDGSMVTGYYQVSNKTYYFDSNGVLR